MKKAIITGASGMVGSIVLKHCLESNEIEKVISLVRRPTGIDHLKLEEIIIQDFLSYEDLEAHFQNVSMAYFCIGVYTCAVSDAIFKTITVDYTKTFVDQLTEQSPQAIFCFLSGAGADQKEKSRMSFAKYKGMAENYLIHKIPNQSFVFRPGYIYPVTKRKAPNFTYRISRSLYPLIKAMGKKYSIKSTELGAAIFQAGFKNPAKTVLENHDILESISA